jgi:hypothetical protein
LLPFVSTLERAHAQSDLNANDRNIRQCQCECAEPAEIIRSIPQNFRSVVVGSGKRFFPDGVRLDLELVEKRRFRKGVAVLRYAVRG